MSGFQRERERERDHDEVISLVIGNIPWLSLK